MPIVKVAMRVLTKQPGFSDVVGAPTRVLEFSPVYDAWFKKVLPWLRAFGTPESDLEDLAQEVFLVVKRKLPDFDGENLAGWIYRIAQHTASDHRRRAWFRNLFSRSEKLEDHPLEHIAPTQLDLVERKQAQQILYRLLDKMSVKRRTAFVLFEIEGYRAEEIALLENIPVGTVRTRVHHARKDFYELVAVYKREEGV